MMIEKTCPRCNMFFLAKVYGKRSRTCCSPSCSAKGHNKRHGMCLTREYKCWELLRDRVNNPNHHAWERYGGRGIKICDRWNLFENFYADMGPKPGPKYSIDRIDNDGDYEPGNCRWATKTEQSRNRACVSPPEFDEAIRAGISRRLGFSQIARELGRTVGSVTARANRLGLKSGWQGNKASTPLPQQGETET